MHCARPPAITMLTYERCIAVAGHCRLSGAGWDQSMAGTHARASREPGLGGRRRRACGPWENETESCSRSCTCRCVLEQNFVTCQIGTVRRGSKMCARVKLGLRSPTPSFHLRRRHASTPSRDNNADGLALGTCLDNTVHPCPPAVVQASHDVESHEIGR